MNLARSTALVLEKEFRIELRTHDLTNTVLFFVLMVAGLFSFAFEPSATESRAILPGLIWIAFFFAGTLMLQLCFVREQVNDTLAALRLAPIDPFAILLGKILANFAFLAVAEIVFVPVFSLFYNVSVIAVLGRLMLVLFLGTFGLAVAGTVFSAMTAQARMRELLLPLLLLPVLAPVLIAGVEATAGLLSPAPALGREWLTMLCGFDIVFLTTTWLLAGFLVEE
ncbi:MAG TPA: heme exporter protein CcmB [Candidatus Dormibacteraeota bacterium]|nr:heme exporter protein CcmB [Candidatus Dormibacteraeota bacterium]